MGLLSHLLLLLLPNPAAAACRYIALASMQRSGSSEFREHLGEILWLRNLGEHFYRPFHIAKNRSGRLNSATGAKSSTRSV